MSRIEGTAVVDITTDQDGSPVRAHIRLDDGRMFEIVGRGHEILSPDTPDETGHRINPDFNGVVVALAGEVQIFSLGADATTFASLPPLRLALLRTMLRGMADLIDEAGSQ